LKHDVSRSQLYRWRQLLREGRLGGVRVEGFVPAVIRPEAPRVENSGASRGRMEVVSANGRRIIVDRDVDVDALLRLMRGLETLR
jgi:transposase